MNEKIIFDFSELEGKIKQYYGTQDEFAKAIPMSLSSFNQKINNKVDFSNQNIKKMATLLHIETDDIGRIFFKLKV